MANNRMYLLHRPSGRTLYLAKRLGRSWWCPKGEKSLEEELNEFLYAVWTTHDFEGQDDFALSFETDES